MTIGQGKGMAWRVAALLVLCWLLPAVAAAVHLWRRAPLLTGRVLRGVGWASWLVWAW